MDHKTGETTMTLEGKNALREILEKHDCDENGHIDAEEFVDCMYELGVFLTLEQAEYLIKCFDKNKNGKLEIGEIIESWNVIMQHSVCGDDMLEAFRKFDIDGNGYVRLPELQKILTSMGKEPMTGQEAGKVIEDLMKFDKNGDGKFSYGEFIDMYLKDQYPFEAPAKETKTALEADKVVVPEDEEESQQS